MNSHPRAGNVAMTSAGDMRSNRYPMQEVERGTIAPAMQRLRQEIEELNEQISALSERLTPISVARPVGTPGSDYAEEKQPPGSKHAEELHELQDMVRSCRTRINVMVGQLDI